jgi:hypothetical protein
MCALECELKGELIAICGDPRLRRMIRNLLEMPSGGKPLVTVASLRAEIARARGD